jgi:methyl-accepting chemotaxis protein
MNKIPGFGLSARLALNSAVLVVAMLSMSAFVWSRMGELGGHTEAVRSAQLPQLQRLSEFELDVTRVEVLLRQAILAEAPEAEAAALSELEARTALLEKHLAEVGAAMQDEAGRQAFAAVPGLHEAFRKASAETVGLVRQNRKYEASVLLADAALPALARLMQPLQAEKLRQAATLDAGITAVDELASYAKWMVLAAMLAVAGGLLVGSWTLQRALRQLGAEPSQLKAVADAVAAGDLAKPIELRAGDHTSVMAALKTMRDRLATTVSAVRQNADSVATASTQIANGNADLSSRTERQASALRQTAAAMDALDTTVRQNADHARQASELARDSSGVAARGGEAVREVVETMKGINQSSRRIADIIGTIDGIAFQTNILALNAAVEAARAGEQGRGFAVVASEVRGLAQRSTQAAREIKSLIAGTVERVEHGAGTVDRAGATLLEVVGSIERVNRIVGDISSASAEQSTGVGEVGQAVSQMDRNTQENAALVQQGAAAAESLRLQAQALVQAVAVFRLN